MTRRAQMADGTVLEFPDNTPDEVMDRVARQHATSKPAPRKAPPQPKHSFLGDLWDSTKSAAGAVISGAPIFAIPDAFMQAGLGTQRLVNTGLDKAGTAGLNAVGLHGAADWWHRGAQRNEQQLARTPTVQSALANMGMGPQPGWAGLAVQLGGSALGGAIDPGGAARALIPKQAPRVQFPSARPETAFSGQSIPRFKGVTNPEVVVAGQRQNIPIRQPDAIPALQGDMATAEASTYGGRLIAPARASDQQAVQDRLLEIAGQGAQQPENYNLGMQLQTTGKRYIDDSRTIAKHLYTTADEVANGQKINPANALGQVNNEIADLVGGGANINKSQINYLTGLREDLSKPGGVSIPEYVNLRSGARQAIKGDQALTASDAERRTMNVIGAFTQDAADQLPPEANAALQVADKYYAQRMATIKGPVQEFMGTRGNPLSPENAAKRLYAMTTNRQANFDDLSKFWDLMNPQEQADATASIVSKLGSGGNGEFGLGKLATDINNMPANIRQTILNPENVSNLGDLQTIARAKSNTTGGLNNSRSGVVFSRGAAKVIPRLISSGAGAGVGAMIGGPVGAGFGMVAGPMINEGLSAVSQSNAASKLLSPEFIQQVSSNPEVAGILAPYIQSGTLSGAGRIKGLLESLVPALESDVGIPLAARDRKKKQRRQQHIPQP